MFYKENLNFKLLSTKILESYKNTQYFVLTELQNADYSFCPSSIDLIQLNMDLFFKWLLYLEKLFTKISYNDLLTYDDISNPILLYLDHNQETIKELVLSNTNIFKKEISLPWLKIHEYNIKNFKSVIKKDKLASEIIPNTDDCFNADLFTCFTVFSKYIEKYIIHNLYILFEIDYLNCNSNNKCDDNPFFIYDSYTDLYKLIPFSYIAYRLYIYKDFFKNNNYDNIVIKNFSNKLELKIDKLEFINYDNSIITFDSNIDIESDNNSFEN